jgi:hypothetical protein
MVAMHGDATAERDILLDTEHLLDKNSLLL